MFIIVRFQLERKSLCKVPFTAIIHSSHMHLISHYYIARMHWNLCFFLFLFLFSVHIRESCVCNRCSGDSTSHLLAYCKSINVIGLVAYNVPNKYVTTTADVLVFGWNFCYFERVCLSLGFLASWQITCDSCTFNCTYDLKSHIKRGNIV